MANGCPKCPRAGDLNKRLTSHETYPMSQSTSWRPQPPSINDPPVNEYEGEELGEENDLGGMEIGDLPPEGEQQPKPSSAFWTKRAKDAYRFSTTYVDSNYRKPWEDS